MRRIRSRLMASQTMTPATAAPAMNPNTSPTVMPSLRAGAGGPRTPSLGRRRGGCHQLLGARAAHAVLRRFR